MEILIQCLLLVLGFVMLVKGSDWFVDGAAVSISAALKGSADIAIGNIVGSNIFNILFVVGTTALITPVVFMANFMIDTIIAIAAGVLLLLCVFKGKKLTRPAGIVMLVCYAAYFVYLLQ